MPRGIYKRKPYKRKPLSAEHRAKIVAANKRCILSPESRKKIIDYRTNRKHSEETIEKMRNSHKGKKRPPFSREWRKRLSECHKGEKSIMWKGGINKPYSVDWTNFLRISIRERDKYTCKICGEKQGDIAHDVHHIDYDKKNCSPENLVTLCRSCHIGTNHNRDKWIEFFNN